MKSLIKGIIILSILVVIGVWVSPGLRDAVGLTIDDADFIQRAWHEQLSNIVVETEAQVTAVLPEIEDFERRQVFVIELENGHKVQVQHNLDLARGVPVKRGSLVRLRGEYDWTPAGGVIHWTHTDPEGKREGGWIEFAGKRYN